jgi:hypothetical protein
MDSGITTTRETDRQRMLLATGLVCAFVASLLLLFFKEVPEKNQDMVTYMVGQLSGMATMALGFYFISKAGADAADAAKTENTGKMADAITAAANAGQMAGAAGVAAQSTADAAQAAADDIKGQGQEL